MTDDVVNKYKITLEYYDDNWKPTTVVRYEGRILDQMKNLFFNAKHIDRVGDRAIRLTLTDVDGTIYEEVTY